ncbi:hypothetical protein TMES_05185 [Thalassospira mesophila]|uniref:Uncharacterized protein n=1 Tax=Thalassospira mesophila TaxID=1293891 RepID=A0A1Y2L4H3_9PROT|nr:hypothetical protein TMES_05185 [Thalassospira mesophila]
MALLLSPGAFRRATSLLPFHATGKTNLYPGYTYWPDTVLRPNFPGLSTSFPQPFRQNLATNQMGDRTCKSPLPL